MMKTWLKNGISSSRATTKKVVWNEVEGKICVWREWKTENLYRKTPSSIFTDETLKRNYWKWQGKFHFKAAKLLNKNQVIAWRFEASNFLQEATNKKIINQNYWTTTNRSSSISSVGEKASDKQNRQQNVCTKIMVFIIVIVIENFHYT